MIPTFSFFLFAFLGSVSTITAYPTGLYVRQALPDTPKPPACAFTCANMTAPLIQSCVQVFTLCLVNMCMFNEHDFATPFIYGYCAGNGMEHTENGVVVTDIPPLPSGAVATTTNVPLSVALTTIIVTQFVTLSAAPTTTITAETSTSTIVEVETPTIPSTLSTDTATVTLASVTTAPSASSIIIEPMSSFNTLRSPAAISVYVIISFIIIILILIFTRRWRHARQRDYIIPSRRTRGKSFLIDESSLKRRSFNSAIGRTTKPPPIYHLSLKEETPLPAVPIPTKDSSDPSVGIALSYVPQLAITRTPSRSYTALPGHSPSPEPSPESEKSFVAQTFAAGRERAITNIRHSRSGSRSPTSPASSVSSTSSDMGDMYAAATRGPLPAHAYMAPHRPAAPSPLRAQLKAKPVPSRVSTIQEEPRTPYGAQSVFSTATTMSVLNSKIETARRVRPPIAWHVRNPGSAERMEQFMFPDNPQKSLEGEPEITISEAMLDGVPVSRSQTPNSSMHRGAGGSISSISKVQGKLQALVGGIRRERD